MLRNWATLRQASDWLRYRVPQHEPIRVRIDLNAGEPIAEDDTDGRNDLFETAVIEAARITAKAA